MKIDLHLHSLASQYNGDSIKWLGDKEVLRNIFQHNYKMIAFSDHNTFDYQQYLNFRKFINQAMTIMPAIEVNIITDRGKVGNIIFVFREDLDEIQLKEIANICNYKLKKNGITHLQAMKCFANYDTIIIPHVGKSDFLAPSDLSKISFDAFEVSNLNHPNYKKAIKQQPDVSIVAFSDTHIWTSFPQNHKLITDINLPYPTFDELKKALSKNKNFTKHNI